MSGLEIAQEALKAKIKKRTGQQHESELQVKTIREKLNDIQKRVTPEAIKNLNKLLEKQDVAKLYTMLESFTGLIMNSKSPSPHDIKDAIKTQSHLVEQMVGACQISFKCDQAVVDKHKEVLREVQKAFTDSTHPENKFCQPYSAILAWAQNFPFYLQHAAQLNKLISDVSKAKKELELKNEKVQNIKNVVASIEENIQNLQQSIQDDQQRIAQFD